VKVIVKESLNKFLFRRDYNGRKIIVKEEL